MSTPPPHAHATREQHSDTADAYQHCHAHADGDRHADCHTNELADEHADTDTDAELWAWDRA